MIEISSNIYISMTITIAITITITIARTITISISITLAITINTATNVFRIISSIIFQQINQTEAKYPWYDYSYWYYG